MSCDEIAKQIVERFVKITIPLFDEDEETPTGSTQPVNSSPPIQAVLNLNLLISIMLRRSEVTRYILMPLTFLVQLCSGMHFMMLSGRVMGTGLFVIGNSWQLFLGKKSITIMLMKP